MPNYRYLTATGVIVPDTSDILTGVQTEYLDTFGQDLAVTPDTPQGVLIVSETLARTEVVNNNAALANQINPNISGGVFLDAICALTGLEREASTQSVVMESVTGVAGTVIPQGSTMQTTSGDLFESSASVTLDMSGNGTVQFNSIAFGPIAAPINTLTQIVGGVLGWETGTNASAAVLGTLTQSDQQLKLTRKQTLALQAVSTPIAITSLLSDIPGFGSLSFRENVTDSTIVIDTLNLLPHSILVCVDGCTDLEVATALLASKNVGCNWNGTTVVDVTDPTTGQVYPVSFYRPTAVPILIQVTVKQNSLITNLTEVVINAILAYVAGQLTGEPGFVVNGDVSCFELSGAINIASPSIFVSNLEISLASSVSFSTTTIPILIYQTATTDSGSITVTITS